MLRQRKRSKQTSPNDDEIFKIEALLSMADTVTLEIFDQFIRQHLTRKADEVRAIQELDSQMGRLQNLLLSLTLHLKQNYLIKAVSSAPPEVHFYTKQEVANRYRVSMRTISNWIIDGLECIEIGGVKRISAEAVKKFVKHNKSRKFNWRSVCVKK